MTEIRSQDFDATITWTSDWTAHCAKNGINLATAVVTCPTVPTVTIENTTVTLNKVSFRVSVTGIGSDPQVVPIVVSVTLSNGDADERNFLIQFTNT